MSESAVQIPALIQTMGGHRSNQRSLDLYNRGVAQSVSEGHTGNGREQNGQHGQEDVGATHGSRDEVGLCSITCRSLKRAAIKDRDQSLSSADDDAVQLICL